MDPFWKQIIALIVLALPVFAIPAILKASSGLLGRIHTLSHGFSGSKLGVNKLAEKTNFNNSHARKQFSEFHQRQKADRKNRIAAGNYRGTNANPLNWGRNATSDLNSRLNRSGAFNTVSMGFGAERDLALQRQNREDQQKAMALFGNDDLLVRAWALAGGDSNRIASTGLNLNTAQVAQFKRMEAAGYGNQSQSFVAAQQYLAENGKGYAQDMLSALHFAQEKGANATDVEGAYQTAKASFRGSGRGDVLGELNAIEKANGTNTVSSALFKPDIDTSATLSDEQIKAWNEVTAEKAHREGIGQDNIDPTTGTVRIDSNGNPVPESSYKKWVQIRNAQTGKYDNLISAVTAFDHMEGRAQTLARPQIVNAAKAIGITLPSGAQPSSIPELKEALGIRS
jgi:hypothetical protein